MWHNLWLGNALHFLLQTIKRNASKELCSLMTLKEIYQTERLPLTQSHSQWLPTEWH